MFKNQVQYKTFFSRSSVSEYEVKGKGTFWAWNKRLRPRGGVVWALIFLHTRIIEFRRVCSELLSKGRQWVINLEDYRTRVGTWAVRGVPRRGDANRTTGGCLGLTVLGSMILARVTDDWWNWPESRSCCGSGETQYSSYVWEDALLDIHLLRPESLLISCNILPGISDHNGVLFEVEWDGIVGFRKLEE
jgi:hypothetical protein